jgi:hypothetical protein
MLLINFLTHFPLVNQVNRLFNIALEWYPHIDLVTDYIEYIEGCVEEGDMV